MSYTIWHEGAHNPTSWSDYIKILT